MLDPEDFTPAGCLAWLALVASTVYVLKLAYDRFAHLFPDLF